jgi:DNA-binding response OmpR family regulator
MKTFILIVEDDAALARVLYDNLTFEGFSVDIASSAREATSKSRERAPDLVILDVMLPDGNGFALCAHFRQRTGMPVIMLTALSQKSDKLKGLELGADDYVTKPFDLEELLARVHAVLRRTRPDLGLLTLGQVTIDFVELRATCDGHAIHLTHREFEILRYLTQRKGRIVSRDELLSRVWDYTDAPITRSVDHAIARLRKKIERNPHEPSFIHSVHGHGYCLTPDGCAEGYGRSISAIDGWKPE